MRVLFEYCGRDDRSHAKYLNPNMVVRLDYWDNPYKPSIVYFCDGTSIEIEYPYAKKLRSILDDHQ